jgi:hypothetical protein
MGVVTEESASEAILNENHDFRFITAGTPPANVPATSRRWSACSSSPTSGGRSRRAGRHGDHVDKWEDAGEHVTVEVAVPSNVRSSRRYRHGGGPPIPDPIGPVARFAIQPTQDWLTASGAVTQLDGTPIGAHGGVTLEAYRGVTRGLYLPVSGTTRVAPIIAREGNR